MLTIKSIPDLTVLISLLGTIVGYIKMKKYILHTEGFEGETNKCVKFPTVTYIFMLVHALLYVRQFSQQIY